MVSEEGKPDLAIVRAGTYVTVDGIDGTIMCREHVQNAKNKRLANPCIDPELKFKDYSFLVGIVERCIAIFGCAYNYVTGETFFLDASSKEHSIRRNWNAASTYRADYAHYADHRATDRLHDEISGIVEKMGGTTFRYGSLLSALHLQFNGHKSAIMVHNAQQNGL